MGPGNRPSRHWLAVITAAVLVVTSGGLAVLSAGPASAATVFYSWARARRFFHGG